MDYNRSRSCQEKEKKEKERSRSRHKKKYSHYKKSHEHKSRRHTEYKKREHRHRSKEYEHRRHIHHRHEKHHRHYDHDKIKNSRENSSKYSSKSRSKSEENRKSGSENKVKYSSEEGKDRNKDEGHYKYTIGEIIKDYKILKHISDGTFGRVFEVLNMKNNQIFAMKIIRAVERYVESAKTEAEILKDLHGFDLEDRFHIVRLFEEFEHGKNYCMVFEKLGLSLYELLKKNDYKGYPIHLIQSFLKQILVSIGFLHQHCLTHTDLKPENILLMSDKYIVKSTNDFEKKTEHTSEDDGRSSTCSKSQKGKYYLPIDERIKIIDFGGATYDCEHHSSVINTRQYRAPEIILTCCEWTKISDIWCMGCIALELYSGDLFFETHDSYEHLALIERASGHIPYWMCIKADVKLSKHFIYEEEHYRKYKTYFDWPKHAKDKNSVSKVKYMKKINEIISKDQPELADLLQKMLTIDPSNRIDCNEALNHPFFLKNYSKNINTVEEKKKVKRTEI